MAIASPLTAPAEPEPTWEQPGGLGIREKRSFATWQLVLVAFVALLTGMVIGDTGRKPASGAAGGTPFITLPSSPTGALHQPTMSVQTVTPGSVPPTTAAAPITSGASTTSIVASGAPQVELVARTQGSGPSDLPTFKTAGTWTVGWAFSCVGAASGTGPFTITVVSASGASDPAPAVSESSRNGQGVTKQPARTGSQHLHIATDPACQWAVKVLGVAG